MKAVVFDLDGTLVDSAPDLHEAANTLLAEYDCAPISLKTTRSFIGHGISNLVLQVMEARTIIPELTDQWVTRFKELYAASPSKHSSIYDGVKPLLHALCSNEFALGLCTNKDKDITQQILKDFDLIKFFEVVVGGNTLSVSKPDPEPLNYAFKGLSASTKLFVGDSEVDAQTAMAAKVPFALYACGYRKSPVSAINHDFAFETYVDLFEYFELAIPINS